MSRVNNNKNESNRRRRRRGNRLRQRGRKRLNNNTRAESGYRLQVSPGNQLAMPDSEIVDMPFTDTALQFVPAGANFGAFRYRGNSPFDPDPLLGGESALYYTTYSVLYRRYRVITSKIEVTIANNESFPVVVTFAPTDTDFITNISSVARALDLGEMPYGQKPHILSAKGGMDRVTFSQVVHWPTFIGNKQSWMTDDTYSSLNNTNPVNVVDLTFAVAASTPFVNGITRHVKIIYRVLWNDRNFLPASLRLHHDVHDSNEEKVKELQRKLDDLQLTFLKK